MDDPRVPADSVAPGDETKSPAGSLVALVVTTPFAASLLGLWRTRPGAALAPSIFAAGVLVCSMLALVQSRFVAVGFHWRRVTLLTGFSACGLAIWMGAPYIVATTPLIALCFVVIGKRPWPIMICVWLGSEFVAYGIFKELLGIPIH